MDNNLFCITEQELLKSSGYGRSALQAFRLGHKKRHKDSVYSYAPTLVKGKDWEQFGRAVLYTEHVRDTLKKPEN